MAQNSVSSATDRYREVRHLGTNRIFPEQLRDFAAL